MIHGDLLGERARLTPDKAALVVVDGGERLTYRQLDERAVRCAAAWRGLGLARGERVAILAHNRVEYLDAFFAAPKCGIVLVPLGTRLTARELAHVVRDAGVSALLYDGELAEVARALRELVEVPRWIALDEPMAAADARHRDLCAAADPAAFGRTRCAPEDLWCLLYTSGTTGRPKGVMIPHRMVVWNGYNTVCGWQLRADDVSPVFTPLYHAGGLMAFLVPVFTIGGTVVLHRGFDPAEVWRTIEAEGCTVVLGVPTIWKLLMEAPELATADLSRVRWLISGGAPLPHYVIDAYQRRGVVFKQGFGMTEVGVNCFAMTLEDSTRKVGSIGQPMMFTEVRLVDVEGREVPVGEVGEMLFRGPHVALGYWNDPAATAAAFDAEGWLHSGDLARRDEDGFFYVAGREKDMIISGGVNVYPAEIEAQLLLHPQVEDAAVVGVADATWGEVGVAFVVPRPGAALSPDALADHLGERLARFKLPKRYRFVDALPRTAYGKVVKAELRRQLEAAPAPAASGAGEGAQ
ncbi:MAG TPA: long-chain fatty acid--CoA ligase [Thermoanaerobaculia bacterium]|nr:long-chain fatty acid--CoA ligase [Thermoanaerobaculia bacterium]